ncbi:hypothetical protein [Nocardia lijiangensis]|uniref:hypothetical protein n=1 Tax=Nocardia lijiangensis TaxID=299618 RepID=UPI00082B3811|nr:hypothetical protein [Nocardia lijiangensis]
MVNTALNSVVCNARLATDGIATEVGRLRDQPGAARPQLLIVGDDSAAVRIVEPSTGWHLAEIRRRTTPIFVGYCGDILCLRDGDGLSILRYDLTRW